MNCKICGKETNGMPFHTCDRSKEMTDPEQIIELAKLDGRRLGGMVEIPTHPAEMIPEPLPDYLNSWDAIVPVIEKQDRGVHYTFGWELSRLLHFDEELLSDVDNLGYRFTDCLLATPRQLSEALLRAMGKWKE